MTPRRKLLIIKLLRCNSCETRTIACFVFGNWASRFWDGCAGNRSAGRPEQFAADTAASTAPRLRPNGRFDCAGPVYFDLEIICSTISDSWLRNWEWHKEKKNRHPHQNPNLLLLKP